MTTVRQLIEYLETLDSECQIEVLRRDNNGYAGYSTRFVALDLERSLYHSSNNVHGRYPNGYLEIGEE